MERPGVRSRVAKGIALCAACGFCLLGALAAGASAAIFTNPAPLAVPGTGTAGPASPYPSTISVADMPVGLAAGPKVTLSGVSHAFPRDLDVLLVGPTGSFFTAQRSLLMSDVCGGGLTPLTGQNFTFVPAGGLPMPAAPAASCQSSNNWAPSDGDPPPDVFPGPAPPVVSDANLAQFAGTKTNGTWQLWVNDDLGGQSGAIAGGWSIELLPAVKCGGKSATVYSHVGTPGDDVLQGTIKNDVMLGMGGDDRIKAGLGADVICGGTGNDVMFGGNGADRLFGQAGKDRLGGGIGVKDACVGGKGKDRAGQCEKLKGI
jgi:RTX calcium-binding nonapeptide repeat (4 copies)